MAIPTGLYTERGFLTRAQVVPNIFFIFFELRFFEFLMTTFALR